MRLENGLDVLSGLHWHGLNPPWRQDGVPYISGPPVAPGKFADYSFPALPAGTRWMHSHFGLQEQNLLAAPLIVREQSAIRSGLQEVVVLLEDFSWRKPSLIFEELRKPKPMAGMGNMSGGMSNMSRGGMNMPGMNMPSGGGMDLNDVTYDAFLANDRTLADPQVFDVEKGAEVRLRIINAAASTNFMIELGNVEGTVLTVDGNPVVPLKVRQFPLAIAQRVDIAVRLPADGSALPVLARGEGLAMQTGVVLRPRGAAVAKIPETAATAAPALGLMDEMKLRAAQPLPSRRIDRSVPVDLVGNMTSYTWGMAVHGMEARAGHRGEGRAGRAGDAQHHHDGASHAHARPFLPGHGDQWPGVRRRGARRGAGAAAHDGEGRVRRRQSRPVGLPLPQPLSHGSGHVRDGGLSRVQLMGARASGPLMLIVFAGSAPLQWRIFC